MTPQSVGQHNEIKLIWGEPDDLEIVWQFEQSCKTHPHSREFYKEAVRYRRILLAWDGSELIGYLIYQIIWGNTAFLALGKVQSDYRRNGIGTSMVKLLEERLVAQGFDSYVTSSEATNQHTKHLLPSIGFAQIGELQMQHGSEIFYLKQLR